MKRFCLALLLSTHGISTSKQLPPYSIKAALLAFYGHQWTISSFKNMGSCANSLPLFLF